MSINKHIFAMICMCASIFGAHADDSLKLYLKNGETVLLLLSDHPTFEFAGDDVVVASKTYSIYDIRKYTFNDKSGGVDYVLSDGQDIVMADDSIIVNRSDGEQVSVCDMEGRVYNPRMEEKDSSVIIDISSLAPNVYIISIGSKSIKILKK